MTDILSPVPKLSFLDNNGRPAVGYKLFTYAAGTSTKIATYTDSSGMTPNTNPVVLDFRGEANVWIPPNVSYKYVFAAPNDTDPPGAPIWTVNNVVSSQLITLYGGVDTGSTNAYILSFTANFSAYADGIVIYWVPSNTNTGASTINVNGLGPVAIINQNGTALVAGELVANSTAVIMYKGGSFQLISSGTFVPTRRTEANTGDVTVLSSQTAILTINIGPVAEGQLFLVTAICGMTKGGTDGTSRIDFVKTSGTGTIDFTGLALLLPSMNEFGIGSSTTWNAVCTIIGRATVSGTYVLGLSGVSLGSDSTVLTSAASLTVVTL